MVQIVEAVQTLAVSTQGVLTGLFIMFFLIVSVLLILAVLVQKPQGGGLAGAFGSGAGSGQTAFGAKTGDALTWFTIGAFVVWLLVSVGLNLTFRPADAAPNAEAVSTQTEPEAPKPTDTPVGGLEGAAPGTPAEAPAQPAVEPPAPPASEPPAPAPAEAPASPEPATPEPAPQTPPPGL